MPCGFVLKAAHLLKLRNLKNKTDKARKEGEAHEAELAASSAAHAKTLQKTYVTFLTSTTPAPHITQHPAPRSAAATASSFAKRRAVALPSRTSDVSRDAARSRAPTKASSRRQ